MAKTRRCGNCLQPGHYRSTCTADPQSLWSRCKDLLGKFTDIEIAFQVGADIQTVRKIRKSLNLPRFQRKGPPSWEVKYPGLKERLGHVTDYALAKEYSLSRERVRQIRSSLGYHKKENLELSSEAIDLLGKVSDSEITRKFSLPENVVRRKRVRRGIGKYTKNYGEVIRKVHDKVGVESDRKIAKLLNIPVVQVALYRREHNIPPASLTPKCENFVPYDRDLIVRMYHQGASDKDIAKELGASQAVVVRIRSVELGLFRRKANCPLTPEVKSEILKRTPYESIWRISQSLGVSTTSVRNVQKRAKVQGEP